MDLCPNCGKGYMLTDFSKNRKVYAGSTTKSSYSIGKWLVGAAILGPVGGLAGIGGKKLLITIIRYLFINVINVVI